MNSIGRKTQTRSKAATERKAQKERTHNTKLSLIRLINNIKLKPDQIVMNINKTFIHHKL